MTISSPFFEGEYHRLQQAGTGVEALGACVCNAKMTEESIATLHWEGRKF
jgi:hypothetical protein